MDSFPAIDVMPKICLGTAQFGMPYGITNESGQTSLPTVNNILKLASSSGVTFLDTAQAYGESEKVLGTCSAASSKFRLISKLSKQTSYEFGPKHTHIWEGQLSHSLDNLKIKSLDGFLVHSPADLRKPGAKYLLDWLFSLRARGIVGRIGLSIYDKSDLIDIDLADFDLIQIPLSVYDQRLLNDGTVDLLINSGIVLHARSIYLQGLLLTPPDKWPSWISQSVRMHHLRFQRVAVEANCELIELALNFIKSLKFLEAAVIGVCDLAQLKSLLETWSSIGEHPLLDWSKWGINDSSILDPRQWPR